MAKITGLEQKTFQGKPSGYKITLDDGRTGNLEEKQSDKGLRVGDDVAVTEIPYTSKAGNKSILFGLRLTTGAIQAPVPKPASAPILTPTGVINERILTLKAEASLELAKVVLDALFDGKTDGEKAMAKHKEYKEYLFAIIDECAK